MPKIIYKQQHIGDNGRKFSASRNSHYVKYIGEREHVLKSSHESNLVKYMGEREHAAKLINKKVKKAEADELVTYDVQSKDKEKAKYDENIDKVSEEMLTEPENGLFGVINGEYSDSYSTVEMQKYVRKISTPHRNVFHSIFSFTPESAAEAGLNSLDDWEKWVKYHISDIANGMNMKIENIEYLAAVHLKEGQPHVHIMWWDIQQRILINKVDPLICDKIRIDAIRSTYRDLFTEIYNKEEIMRRSMRKEIGEYTIQNVINGAADNYTSNIYAALYQLYRELPPKGQLKYKIISNTHPEVARKLDELTHYIIDNNPTFKAQYDEICELRLMYNELLHSEESVYGNFQITSYMKQVNDKIEKAVGNEILRIIKAEKQAGHFNEWNSSDYHNTSNITSEEVPHDDTPVARKLYISSYAIREARNEAKDKDYSRALELFSKEAEKGNILAKYEIADLCRRNLCQGNAFEIYREALNGFLEIEPRTRQKAYVHYRIGRMFYDGYGTDIDNEEAFKWLKKAADEGNHLSEFVVGKMLCNGTGTERDTEAGTEYLTRAANSGNEYAQNYLDSRTSWEQACVVKLVGSVGRLLSENLESSRAAMAECSAAVFGHGDLSKEQIRELILKKQDKENTAEM
ncbi:MAG: hypothetical protein ACLUV5_13830 [Oscillospiraceae bacterium]|jgi:hypothetical protein